MEIKERIKRIENSKWANHVGKLFDSRRVIYRVTI